MSLVTKGIPVKEFERGLVWNLVKTEQYKGLNLQCKLFFQTKNMLKKILSTII